MKSLRVAVLLAACGASALGACTKEAPPSPVGAGSGGPAAGRASGPSGAAGPAAVSAPVSLPRWAADGIFPLLPRRCAGAVVVQSLEATGPRLRQHLRRFAEGLGLAVAGQGPSAGLLLGLADPFTEAARARFSIDGRRPAALTLDGEGRAPLVLVPVLSAERFLAALREELTRGGAVTFEPAGAGARPTVVKRGGAPLLAFAARAQYLALAVSAGGALATDTLEVWQQQSRDESLTAAPGFRAAASALEAPGEVFAYFDGDGLYRLQVAAAGALSDEDRRSLRRLFEPVQGLAGALSLAGDDLRAEGFVALDGAAAWAPILAPEASPPSLARYVEAGAPAVASLAVDGVALLGKALALDPALKNALAQWSGELEQRLGLHFERELLGNLTGRVLVALHGAEPQLLAVASDPARRAGTLQQLQVVVAAGLRDKAALERALRGAADLLRQRGAASPLALAEKAAGVARYYELQQGGRSLLALAVVDDALLLTLGAGRMEKTLALAAGQGAAPLRAGEGPSAAAAASRHAFHLALRFPGLAALVRSLELSPLRGQTPAVETAVRERLLPWLQRYDALLGGVRFEPRGLRLRLDLRALRGAAAAEAPPASPRDPAKPIAPVRSAP